MKELEIVRAIGIFLQTSTNYSNRELIIYLKNNLSNYNKEQVHKVLKELFDQEKEK